MKNVINYDTRTLHPIRVLFICVIAMLLIATSNLASAVEPVLELAFTKQRQKLARLDLLRHPDVRTISIPADVSYKRKMEYRALPLKAILRNLRDISTVQFKSEDGFVANIPAELLSGPSEPWLAIEPAHAPWPELKPDGRSAGAFYLVWLAPEKSNITPEFWLYRLAVISEVATLPERYPRILPDASLKKRQYRISRHASLPHPLCELPSDQCWRRCTVRTRFKCAFQPDRIFSSRFLTQIHPRSCLCALLAAIDDAGFYSSGDGG